MRLRLFAFLFASLLIPLFGCGSSKSEGDPGPEQLLKLINDYRAIQSPPLAPWIFDTAPNPGDMTVGNVARGYAEFLNNQPPLHQFPYSEDADGKGLSGRLTNAGISVSACVEVGQADAATTNAQLFFTNYVEPSGILIRTDIDRVGVGHVIPPRGFGNFHYWVLDVVKREIAPPPP